jgi:septum formation protein
MSNYPVLILASSSPRRQELIRSLGLPFKIIVSDADEHTAPTMTPAEIVETLSMRKAQAVFDRLKGREKEGIIIGSDTIVVFEGKVLGKPEDEQDAFQMLHTLQGKTHQVYSGVACIDAVTGKHIVNHRMTSVTMKALSEQQIKRYINTGEPKDKAGSYGIQGLGATIVEKIAGDYFNVVGLPLSLLSDVLSEFGVEVI